MRGIKVTFKETGEQVLSFKNDKALFHLKGEEKMDDKCNIKIQPTENSDIFLMRAAGAGTPPPIMSGTNYDLKDDVVNRVAYSHVTTTIREAIRDNRLENYLGDVLTKIQEGKIIELEDTNGDVRRRNASSTHVDFMAIDGMVARVYRCPYKRFKIQHKKEQCTRELAVIDPDSGETLYVRGRDLLLQDTATITPCDHKACEVFKVDEGLIVGQCPTTQLYGKNLKPIVVDPPDLGMSYTPEDFHDKGIFGFEIQRQFWRKRLFGTSAASFISNLRNMFGTEQPTMDRLANDVSARMHQTGMILGGLSTLGQTIVGGLCTIALLGLLAHNILKKGGGNEVNVNMAGGE